MKTQQILLKFLAVDEKGQKNRAVEQKKFNESVLLNFLLFNTLGPPNHCKTNENATILLNFLAVEQNKFNKIAQLNNKSSTKPFC